MARIEVALAGDLWFELKNVHFRPLLYFLFLAYLQLINLFSLCSAPYNDHIKQQCKNKRAGRMK